MTRPNYKLIIISRSSEGWMIQITFSQKRIDNPLELILLISYIPSMTTLYYSHPTWTTLALPGPTWIMAHYNTTTSILQLRLLQLYGLQLQISTTAPTHPGGRDSYATLTSKNRFSSEYDPRPPTKNPGS